MRVLWFRDLKLSGPVCMATPGHMRVQGAEGRALPIPNAEWPWELGNLAVEGQKSQSQEDGY